MSDRQTQAIFAAIKAFNGGTNTADVNARHGFMAGVEWADANPKPHTTTRSWLRDTAMMLAHTRQDEIEAMLPGLLGIEGGDDD